VIAGDLPELAPLPGVTVIRRFHRRRGAARGRARLGGRPSILSFRTCPQSVGRGGGDQARSIHLCELALEFGLAHLKPGGTLLVKSFQGAGFPALLQRLRGGFERVVSRKPDASRSRSSEMYLLARGPRAKP
jgi:23S rRNA (uridine2552-2'-O)-methyltransferase